MMEPVIGSFDDIKEIKYVKFVDGKVRVLFTSSDFLVTENNFSKKSYVFAVEEEGEEKLMGVTSNRLMLRLKGFVPLVGRTFDLVRIGAGMETDYSVTEVL